MKTLHQNEIEEGEISFFDNYYEGQAYNSTGWRLRLQRELRSLLHFVGKNPIGRVLSLGCGDGQFEIMLAPYAECVTGLDISPQAISLARRKASDAGVDNVEFHCQRLSEMRWDETYDTVVCLAFLHHVPPTELLSLIHQIYNHLVPNGFFYSQDPNVNGVLRKIGRVIIPSRYEHYHSPDERELDPNEIAITLRQAGFSSISIGYIDFTLIPALYILAKGPHWPLYVCAAFDWLLCHSPLAPLASGFTLFSQK